MAVITMPVYGMSYADAKEFSVTEIDKPGTESEAKEYLSKTSIRD